MNGLQALTIFLLWVIQGLGSTISEDAAMLDSWYHFDVLYISFVVSKWIPITYTFLRSCKKGTKGFKSFNLSKAHTSLIKTGNFLRVITDKFYFYIGRNEGNAKQMVCMMKHCQSRQTVSYKDVEWDPKYRNKKLLLGNCETSLSLPYNLRGIFLSFQVMISACCTGISLCHVWNNLPFCYRLRTVT